MIMTPMLSYMRLKRLIDKRDKQLKLDEETKNLIKEIKEKEKAVNKKEYSGFFNYEPSLNTQVKPHKRLDKIKQQKIKLNKDERNSTNSKKEDYRHNMTLSVIDKIY